MKHLSEIFHLFFAFNLLILSLISILLFFVWFTIFEHQINIFLFIKKYVFDNTYKVNQKNTDYKTIRILEHEEFWSFIVLFLLMIALSYFSNTTSNWPITYLGNVAFLIVCVLVLNCSRSWFKSVYKLKYIKNKDISFFINIFNQEKLILSKMIVLVEKQLLKETDEIIKDWNIISKLSLYGLMQYLETLKFDFKQLKIYDNWINNSWLKIKKAIIFVEYCNIWFAFLINYWLFMRIILINEKVVKALTYTLKQGLVMLC